MTKCPPNKTDNYSDNFILALEQKYCSTCSAAVVSSGCVVSSHGLGARIVSKIYNGGRQAVYTATIGAMLVNNLTPCVHAATVPAGQTSSGVIVRSGDSLLVQGTAVSTIVLGGGNVSAYDTGILENTQGTGGTTSVYQGGQTKNTQLSAQGAEHVSSGGTASGTVVNSAAIQTVFSGGTALNTVVNSAGTQIVSSGGVASSATISEHGTLKLAAGGSAVDVIQKEYAAVQATVTGTGDGTYLTGTNANGQPMLLQNGSASGFVLNKGGALNVSSGGYAQDIVQSVGGNVNVLVQRGDNTYASGRNQDGQEFSLNAGVAKSFIVNEGGSQIIANGGVASNTHNKGGETVVSGGGKAVDMALSGGKVVVSNGGVVSNITKTSGLLHIAAGGQALNVIDKGGSLSVDLEGGNTATKLVGTRSVGSASSAFSVSNGVASNLYIGDGVMTMRGAGASAVNTRLGSDGKQIVSSGASALQTSVFGGISSSWSATQEVLNGGVAIGTFVNGWHGSQIVRSGGSALDTKNDGVVFIDSGGYAKGLVNTSRYTSVAGRLDSADIQSGSLYVASNGVVNSAHLTQNAYLRVDDGASATHIQQDNYATIRVDVASNATTYMTGSHASGTFALNNGVASGFLVEARGYHNVMSGGSSLDIIQKVGGNVYADVSGGDTTKVTGSNAGGSFYLSNGVASGFILYDSQVAQRVFSGGVANQTVVVGSGLQEIHSGGVANTTEVRGGSQVVLSGGYAAGTTIYRGEQSIRANASASGTVLSGGSQWVLRDGKALNTFVSSGGSQIINQGGVADGTRLYSGGHQIISAGGSSINAVLHAGANINLTVQKTADGTLMNGTNQDGASFYYSNGVASNFIVYGNNGFQNISSGGSSFNLIQSAGGRINVEVLGGDTTKVTGTNQLGETMTLSNGVASNFVLTNWASHYVASGGKSYNVTQLSGGVILTDALSGDTQTVISGTNAEGNDFYVSGNKASNFVVNGGSFALASGAVAQNTVVRGGSQIISSGASASATRVNFATNVIFAGGVGVDTQVQNKGQELVYSDGKANGTILSSYASQILYQGGEANRTSVQGGSQFIGASATANDTVVNSGYQFVSSAGKANRSVIKEGGSQIISSGGSGIGTTLSSGGKLFVMSGASALDINQLAGGALATHVVQGSTYITGRNESTAFRMENGVAYDFVLNSGGEQQIYSNGIASKTIINSGGEQKVSATGWAYGTVVNNGGDQVLFSGGRASGTVLNGGTQTLQVSAIAHNTVVNNGSQILSSGGVANATVLKTGGVQIVDNVGNANDTVVSGGTQELLEGAFASHAQLYANGVQNVSSGGSAARTEIFKAGVQNLLSGSIASNTAVSSGGAVNVLRGALSEDITQAVGGNINVIIDGTDNETKVSGTNQRGAAFGFQNGVGSNFVLNAGALQEVVSGGVAKATVISGGKQNIAETGIASNTVMSGGEQNVSSGGSAIGTEVFNTGVQNLLSGSIARNTTVSAGGAVNVSRGALSEDITQAVGGNINVIIDGTDNETKVSGTNQRGAAFGFQNGVGSNFVLNAGALQEVVSGGVAKATVISGGTQNVSSTGVANNTEITGGTQNISSAGVANNTEIAGGTQNISSAGLAKNTVMTGGVQNVLNGGSAAGNLISGGTQNVYGGASATSATLFNAGVQNVLGGGMVQDGRILGGTQNISAAGLAKNTVMTGGVQNILSGAQALNNTISGGVQNVSGKAADTLLSGGAQYVFAGGSASATQVKNGAMQTISRGGYAVNTQIDGGFLTLHEGGRLDTLTANDAVITLDGDTRIGGLAHFTGNTVVDMDTGTTGKSLSFQDMKAQSAGFKLNVDLENQTADKINVAGSYEGNAILQLTNIGAMAKETSREGIKLVEFADGAAVNGTFELLGGQWDDGGYVYKLGQGNTHLGGEDRTDYYLRNMREYTSVFKTMLNVPLMNVMVARTGMNSLQKRLGDLHNMDNSGKKQGVWTRSYYKDLTVEDLTKTDINLFGAEAGYDWLFRADEPTKLYAGVLLGFVQASNIKAGSDSDSAVKGKGTSPSVGIYATLVNDDRWFVDIAARNFWTKLDMKNYSAMGTELTYEPYRNIFATSVEVGKSFVNAATRDRYIRIEPKAEVRFMNASADKANVKNGVGKLTYDSTNYLNAKAAVLLSYNAVRKNGLLIEPLLELAYHYEFMGESTVAYGGAAEKDNLKGGSVEANVGLNMQLTDNLYWYSLGSYEAGDKVKGWGVYAGIRYAFGGKDAAAYKKEGQPEYKLNQPQAAAQTVSARKKAAAQKAKQKKIKQQRRKLDKNLFKNTYSNPPKVKKSKKAKQGKRPKLSLLEKIEKESRNGTSY